MKDKIIKCEHCAQDFAWTIEEQEFYKRKGWQEPKHCPICRGALKAAREDKFRGKIKTG